jgi:hypothetical protein
LNSRPPTHAVPMTIKDGSQKENTLPSIGLRHCRSNHLAVFRPSIYVPSEEQWHGSLLELSGSLPGRLDQVFPAETRLNQPGRAFARRVVLDRRPKVLCANLILLFSYILILVCLLYFLPESAPVLLVWLVVGGTGVMVDCFRLDRWRREYELSIKRLILFLSKPK